MPAINQKNLNAIKKLSLSETASATFLTTAPPGSFIRMAEAREHDVDCQFRTYVLPMESSWRYIFVTYQEGQLTRIASAFMSHATSQNRPVELDEERLLVLNCGRVLFKEPGAIGAEP